MGRIIPPGASSFSSLIAMAIMKSVTVCCDPTSTLSCVAAEIGSHFTLFGAEGLVTYGRGYP